MKIEPETEWKRVMWGGLAGLVILISGAAVLGLPAHWKQEALEQERQLADVRATAKTRLRFNATAIDDTARDLKMSRYLLDTAKRRSEVLDYQRDYERLTDKLEALQAERRKIEKQLRDHGAYGNAVSR